MPDTSRTSSPVDESSPRSPASTRERRKRPSTSGDTSPRGPWERLANSVGLRHDRERASRRALLDSGRLAEARQASMRSDAGFSMWSEDVTTPIESESESEQEDHHVSFYDSMASSRAAKGKFPRRLSPDEMERVFERELQGLDMENDDDDDDDAGSPSSDEEITERSQTLAGGASPTASREPASPASSRSRKSVTLGTTSIWSLVSDVWSGEHKHANLDRSDGGYTKPTPAMKLQILSTFAHQSFNEKASVALIGGHRRTAKDRWRTLRNVVLFIASLQELARRNEGTKTELTKKSVSLRTHIRGLVSQDTRDPNAKSGRLRSCVIMPNNPKRLLWDVSSSLLLLIMLFYIPYNVAFVGDSLQYRHFDDFVTTWFTVDIILSFFTAYEDDGKIVVSREKIARHYMRGYFVIDVISTIPYDIILGLAMSNRNSKGDAYARLSKVSKIPRMLRYMRVFKLFKLIRLYSKDSLLTKVMYYVNLNPLALRLGQIMLLAVFSAHLFACYWYTLGTKYKRKNIGFEDCMHADGRFNKNCTWLQARGLKEGDGDFFLYVTSMYWAVTTIMTVGFGDITPQNLEEMIYTCFVMICGVSWYGVIISSVGKMYEALSDKDDDGLQWRSTVLTKFVHANRIPAPLAASMHNYLQRQHQASHSWRSSRLDASHLLAQLSKPLRRVLALHLERKLLAKVPFFDHKSRAFVADCALVLSPLLTAQGEVIVRRRRPAEALHFVVSGSIALRVSLVPGARELARIEHGSYFGDVGCLLGVSWEAHLVSAGPTELQLVLKEDLLQILTNFPEISEQLHSVATSRIERAAQLFWVNPNTMSPRESTSGPRAVVAPPALASLEKCVLIQNSDVGAFLLDFDNKEASTSVSTKKLRATLRTASCEDDEGDAGLVLARRVATQARYLLEEHLCSERAASSFELSQNGRARLYLDLVSLIESDVSLIRSSLLRRGVVSLSALNKTPSGKDLKYASSSSEKTLIVKPLGAVGEAPVVEEAGNSP